MNKLDRTPFTLDMPMQHIEKHSWVHMPLPDGRALLRYTGWAVGRLGFSSLLLVNTIVRASLKLAITGCNMLETVVNKLLKVYDAMPHMGTPVNAITVDSTAVNIPQEYVPSIVNLLDRIKGKHVLIIGSTGTGKSTLAQWLAYQVANTVKVYDPDATPQEWQGLEVVGRGGNFNAISHAMNQDLIELENRAKQRAEHGDRVLEGMDMAILAEEFPALVDEIPTASEWMGKIARRGRKPKMFLCILSQSDTVTALGIEGDGAIRSNFCVVRLGSHAVSHAKKLKRDDIVQWLGQHKYRAICDEEAIQLPDLKGSFSVQKTLYIDSESLCPEPPKPFPPNAAKHSNESFGEVSDWQKTALAALKTAGYSDSRIIKEIMGFTGNKYQDGKRVLAEALGHQDG